MKNKEWDIGRKTEKQLMKYIDKNLSKGYSIKSIRKALVKSGCGKALAGYLIGNYRQ